MYGEEVVGKYRMGYTPKDVQEDARVEADKIFDNTESSTPSENYSETTLQGGSEKQSRDEKDKLPYQPLSASSGNGSRKRKNIDDSDNIGKNGISAHETSLAIEIPKKRLRTRRDKFFDVDLD